MACENKHSRTHIFPSPIQTTGSLLPLSVIAWSSSSIAFWDRWVCLFLPVTPWLWVISIFRSVMWWEMFMCFCRKVEIASPDISEWKIPNGAALSSLCFVELIAMHTRTHIGKHTETQKTFDHLSTCGLCCCCFCKQVPMTWKECWRRKVKAVSSRYLKFLCRQYSAGKILGHKGAWRF